MAIFASSLAVICKGLMEYLRAELNRGDMRVTVSMGTPADASPSEHETNHRLNLFFFRFEVSGFQPDALPGETWLLRAWCLVTPFALAEDTISAGENDLRLVGEVLRILHEQPVFRLAVQAEEYHIQAVFQNLGLEQINQLWSTQGETVYRPSVLYEFALAPVVPKTMAGEPRRAGEVRLIAGVDGGERNDTHIYRPGYRRIAPVNGEAEWAPGLAFIADGEIRESLHFASDTVPGTLAVWIAGEPGSEASLQWEIWSPAGWQTGGDPVSVTITDAVIDPAAIGSATAQPLALPATEPGQYLLYARRDVPLVGGGTRSVRSNPLLVTITEAGP